MRLYTRRGDRGRTGLFLGGRLSKANPRVEAYGTGDEVVSALGLARSLCQKPQVREALLHLQRQLFIVNMELATEPARYPRLAREHPTVGLAWVEALERRIDSLSAALPSTFVIPGSTPASAALDLARATARRLERAVIVLKEGEALPNPYLLPYLNRLSDLLYALARYEGEDAHQVWREADVSA